MPRTLRRKTPPADRVETSSAERVLPRTPSKDPADAARSAARIADAKGVPPASKRSKQPDRAPSGSRVGIIDAVGRTGSLGLMALLALALEAVLLVWLRTASSGTERSIAGVLMVIVLLALIGAILLIEFIQHRAPPRPIQEAIEQFDKQGISSREIEQRQADELPAPDHSYVIARPPAGWTVRETNLQTIVEEMLGQPIDFSGLTLPSISSILLLEFGPPIIWTPQLDRTRVNGRRFPLLLFEPMGRKLQITSLRRRQPPLYTERSLYDTVIAQVLGMVQVGFISVTSVTPGKLPKTNRDMIVVEMKQTLENVLLGQRELGILRVNIRATAVRGDLFDYILLACNLRLGPGEDPVAEQMDAETAKLLDSFRLLSVLDPAAEALKDSERADRDFDNLISEKGRDFFRHQLGLAVGRLSEMDLQSADGISRAIALLRPFRDFARMLNDDFGLSVTWAALEQAEHGNTLPLRERLLAEFAAPIDSEPAPGLTTSPQSGVQLTGSVPFQV